MTLFKFVGFEPCPGAPHFMNHYVDLFVCPVLQKRSSGQRNWLFTWYPDQDHEEPGWEADAEDSCKQFIRNLQLLADEKSATRVRYFIAQMEICPTTHRLHLQGYMEWTNPIRLGAIKGKMPLYDTIHLEVTLLRDLDPIWLWCRAVRAQEMRLGITVESLTPGHVVDCSGKVRTAAGTIIHA